MPNVFIHSSSLVSHQPTFGQNLDWPDWQWSNEPILYIQEPNYNDYVPAAHTRRLAKMLKSGLVCGIDAMKQSNIEKPDAIITATNRGSLSDTEKFLLTMHYDNERMLNPASFINSTYNTLNGLLGLTFNANCYANTYVHRGFSLVQALQDAVLLIEEKNAQNILVGGFDEISPDHHFLKQRMGYWKEEEVSTQELLKSTTSGTIAGEGAGFFVLSTAQPDESPILLKGIEMIYKPSLAEAVLDKILKLLAESEVNPEDIEVFVGGMNGDARFSYFYDEVGGVFRNATQLAFKHLVGEYETADCAGLWLAHQVLKRQNIPEDCIYKKSTVLGKPIKNVLIYNHYFGEQHIAILLQKTT